MTCISGVRLRLALIVGALAGVGAGLVFATAHAFLIVPIWNRMLGGLGFAAGAGAVGAWTFVELYPDESADRVTRAARAGARYGALLWLAVSPVSGVDALLRAAGILPGLELVGVFVAVVIALFGGSILGWYRRKTRRGMIAGAAAALLLAVAMGGPVPIGSSPRAFGIFLAVLPAAIVAGALVAAAISIARPRRAIADRNSMAR